jgi:hypothetical protein
LCFGGFGIFCSSNSHCEKLVAGKISVDDRCGMELDETDPGVWNKLEAATQEYVDANTLTFQAACDCLAPPQQEEDPWLDTNRNLRNAASKGKLAGKEKSLQSLTV